MVACVCCVRIHSIAKSLLGESIKGSPQPVCTSAVLHFVRKTVLRFTPNSHMAYVAFGQDENPVKSGPKQP